MKVGGYEEEYAELVEKGKGHDLNLRFPQVEKRLNIGITRYSAH